MCKLQNLRGIAQKLKNRISTQGFQNCTGKYQLHHLGSIKSIVHVKMEREVRYGNPGLIAVYIKILLSF